MEDYKQRMAEEYQELNQRVIKLENILYRHRNGNIDFEPNCPIDLLRAQYNAMCAYMSILEVRSEIEDVDLWNKNA